MSLAKPMATPVGRSNCSTPFICQLKSRTRHFGPPNVIRASSILLYLVELKALFMSSVFSVFAEPDLIRLSIKCFVFLDNVVVFGRNRGAHN